MDTIEHVIVGTAGHIDHGKSSLVEALTGTNPDRLEEEKRRGITIDLGFAFLDLGKVHLGFVDVPGHEKFVRNMLAGAGGIDLVMLVVAADEGIKPQTREHFEICRLLGVARGIVALTKCDLVDSDALGIARLEIEEFVRGSFLQGAPVLGVSARTGAGLETLKEQLKVTAGQITARDTGNYFRLPIDRAFAMKGFGTVVTGTLISGEMRVGAEVELHPTRKRLRVRGLHSGGKSIERAAAGQRTAVNLAGIDHGEIRRGMVLAPPGVFDITSRVDARISLLPSSRPLCSHARVHFHQGTAEATAEVVLLDGAELKPGETAFAQLRLSEPLLLLPGDRFILRQLSPVETIGGGIILDTHALRHRRGDASVTAFLETLERGNREEIIESLVAAAPRGLTLAEIVARTGRHENEIQAAVKNLATAGRLRVAGGQPAIAVSSKRMEAWRAAAQKSLEEFHRANPLLPGIPQQDLRAKAKIPRAEVFAAVLEDLTKTGSVTVDGDLVRRAGREIALSPEESRAKELIEREFERAGLKAPGFAEVLEKLPVEAARARKILQILLREGVLVKIAEDLVLHRTASKGLRELVAGYRKQRGDRFNVAAFKELTGVTRKYAIPLLEYLDRERVTRRVGDVRVIL